ncbi:ribonuclease P protein component [bacterium]|nr:ribonuclease P protein component [bacterium]
MIDPEPVDPNAAATDQSFPQENRLLRRPLFLRVYDSGRRADGRYAVIFCLKRDDGGPWRVGLTATKRCGNSVARNRMRRRAREFFRHRRGLIPNGWDFVVNLKSAAAKAEFEKFERDLGRTMGRIGFDLGTEPGP